MFSGSRTLASTLLLLVAGACALSACLLPQEDRVLNFPPLRNRPPRIMEELELTPKNRVIHVDDCFVRLEFSFRAEDPDIDDVLFVRWYVDYPVDEGFVDPEQAISPSGTAIRNESAKLSIDLGGPLSFPAFRLKQEGTHVVEAILFDGRLGAGRQPQPKSPATDGGVENPSYMVSYAWVVEVTRTCP